jgi:trans-2,3-dihydro-3-hydroxyanthranilate isomerase
MENLRYNLVDVFTDRPLEGNPLAVFTKAQGLSTERMQAIAREMNLSETVFFFPPSQGGHARLRIFTPRTELPFAGHPVLGSAWVLAGPMEMELLRLETGAGVIDVQLQREGGVLTSAFMIQPLPTLSNYEQNAELAAALQLATPDFGKGGVVHADNGPRHLLCDLGEAERVEQVSPDFSALARLWDAGVLTYAQTKGGEIRARYFAPGAGINEDPATGSAVGPLGAVFAGSGRLASGETLVVHQGIEMNRPSKLLVRVQVDAGTVKEVKVGGAARVLGRGELSLA